MQSLRKITGAKTRRRIGTYGDGWIICEPEDAEVGEDGLYGSCGTGWACIAMMMY
jgi:hypothetical protein